MNILIFKTIAFDCSLTYLSDKVKNQRQSS